ncbi:MAG: DUF3313 domain-containing protein [Limisphaerales bacterium]
MITSTMNEKGGTRHMKFLTGILAASLLLGLTACSTTHQVRGTPEESGFLKDYSLLKPGKGDEAKLVYFAPDVNWAKFTKIYIEPVELWKSDDPKSKLGKLPKDDQELLVSYFYTALSNSLSKDYTIVDQAGPDTLVVHGALTEAKKSRPVSNLVSSVVPMGIGLSLVKRVIFGTGLGVGECQVEAEFTDGGTGQIVCEAVDRRAGTKALRTKFDGSFGDVKLAMDYWAERCATKLGQLRAHSDDKTEI